jgi:hypothetical protein
MEEACLHCPDFSTSSEAATSCSCDAGYAALRPKARTGSMTQVSPCDGRATSAHAVSVTYLPVPHCKPEIHRVDPEFGSTLTVSNRDSQSNCWVNLRILVNPVNFTLQMGSDYRWSCVACPLGKYTMSTKERKPWQEEDESEECYPCPGFTTTTMQEGTSGVEHCVCNSGYVGHVSVNFGVGYTNCKPCPLGSFKSEPGPQNCTPCGQFTVTDATASTTGKVRSKPSAGLRSQPPRTATAMHDARPAACGRRAGALPATTARSPAQAQVLAFPF